jgi:hypothetical protein
MRLVEDALATTIAVEQWLLEEVSGIGYARGTPQP